MPGVGKAYRAADYLAVAPYFDGLATNACEPDNADRGARSSSRPAHCSRACARTSRARSASRPSTRSSPRRAATPRAGALRLAAYEGGPHLVGSCGGENAAPLTALLLAANRDPAMKALYLDYLAGWRARGGRLFVHFSSTSRFTKWGSWGFAEWYDETGAAKLAALREFAAANPRWWRD